MITHTLIIDNGKMNTQPLVSLLEEYGEVESVDNWVQGLEILKKKFINILFISEDVAANSNIMEFNRENIKNAYCQVILLTHKWTREIFKKTIQLGIVDVIESPFDYATVHGVVSECRLTPTSLKSAPESQSKLDYSIKAFENLPVPLAIISRDAGGVTKINTANKLFEEAFGYGSGELEVQNINVICGSDTSPEFMRQFSTRVNPEGEFFLEQKNYSKSGKGEIFKWHVKKLNIENTEDDFWMGMVQTSIVYHSTGKKPGRKNEVVTIPKTMEYMNQDSQVIFSKTLPTLRQVNLELIREALKRTNYNQSKAAKIIGLTRQALNKRLLRLQQEEADA